MSAGSVYGQISALLRDYLKPLGMLVEAGPLRALRELTAGIVFTGSVQLTNAARLFASNANQLAKAVKRMSAHLADESWDHRDWAGAVLRQPPATRAGGTEPTTSRGGVVLGKRLCAAGLSAGPWPANDDHLQWPSAHAGQRLTAAPTKQLGWQANLSPGIKNHAGSVRSASDPTASTKH